MSIDGNIINYKITNDMTGASTFLSIPETPTAHDATLWIKNLDFKENKNKTQTTIIAKLINNMVITDIIPNSLITDKTGDNRDYLGTIYGKIIKYMGFIRRCLNMPPVNLYNKEFFEYSKAYSLLLRGYYVARRSWDHGDHWFRNPLSGLISIVRYKYPDVETINDMPQEELMNDVIAMDWFVLNPDRNFFYYSDYVEIKFGIVLEMLKDGHKATRRLWHNRDMYIQYDKDEYDMQRIMMHIPNKGTSMVTSYTPNVNDMMANDWVIISDSTVIPKGHPYIPRLDEEGPLDAFENAKAIETDYLHIDGNKGVFMITSALDKLPLQHLTDEELREMEEASGDASYEGSDDYEDTI